MGKPHEGRTHCRGMQLDGTRCKEARRARGITQEQLAGLSQGPSSISLATIKRAESGAMIDLSSATTIATLLGVALDTLAANKGVEAAPLAPANLRAGGDGSQSVAIAVMPFEPLEPGTETGLPPDYFCDGLVDDLLCRLGGWWFPVLSRTSTMRYRGQQVEPAEAGQQLNARYVVAGRVRRDQERVRIAVELVDTESARLIWTGQVNGAGHNVLDLQTQLSADLCQQIGGHILDHASTSALTHPPVQDLNAWDVSLRGAWHYYRATPRDNEQARKFLLQALDKEPRLRCAHYWLCMTFQQEFLHQWSTAPKTTLQHLSEACRQFKRQFSRDAFQQTAAAYAHIYAGQRAAAMAALEEAVGAEPNITPARLLYGQVLAMAARPEEALTQLHIALQLSPLDPRLHATENAIGLAHFVAGRYEPMVEWCQRAVARGEDFGLAHASLAVGHAYLGDREEATRSLQNMRRSTAAAQALRTMMSSTLPEIRERFLHGLELAGLPLSTPTDD